MFIPGVIISIVTFPGIIVHEVSHQLMCRWLKVPVLEVCYFQVGNPSGYVIHERPKEPAKEFWIGVGPFILNTLLGALIAAPAVLQYGILKSPSSIDLILIWLGFSIAMHAFPSTGDAKAIFAALKREETPLLLKVLGMPVVLLIFICAFGSFFWLDAIYGLIVVTAWPHLFL